MGFPNKIGFSQEEYRQQRNDCRRLWRPWRPARMVPKLLVKLTGLEFFDLHCRAQIWQDIEYRPRQAPKKGPREQRAYEDQPEAQKSPQEGWEQKTTSGTQITDWSRRDPPRIGRERTESRTTSPSSSKVFFFSPSEFFLSRGLPKIGRE